MSLRGDMFELLQKEGFKLVSINKHFKWSDGKHTIITSASPSDHRALNKLRGDIRKKRRGTYR